MIRQWALEGWRTYVGNATATREYRTQLRGTRAIFVWTLYLFVLIVMAGATYAMTVQTQGATSIASLQMSLQGFYMGVSSMLGGLIAIGAPAINATAITIERQRQSLDLLFSAPVSARYLLVGKMVASMRYVLMLIVLALPVMAIGVVLGGSTWMEVVQFACYLLTYGAVVSAIGLLMSALSNAIIPGILWTYFAAGVYTFFVTTFAFPFYVMSVTSGFGGPGMASKEAPWFATLSPFLSGQFADTVTTIGPVTIPNWLTCVVGSYFIANWFVHGASSALSTYGSPEVRKLRLYSVAIVAILYASLTSATMASTLMSTVSGSFMAAPVPAGTGIATGTVTATTTNYLGTVIGGTFGYAASFCGLLSIYWSCYGKGESRKYAPGRILSWRGFLNGGASGAFPLTLAVAIAAVLGAIGSLAASPMAITTLSGPTTNAGAALALAFSDWQLWSLITWGFGFLAMVFGICRFVSAFARDLKIARAVTLGVIIAVVGLPIPAYATFLRITTSSYFDYDLTVASVFMPLGRPEFGVPYGFGMLIAGAVLCVIGEGKRVKRFTAEEMYDERSETAA